MSAASTEAKPRLLDVRGLSKRFPGVVALHDVDFDVRTGEVHVLLGGNGAGKSTLVKILSGAYRADAGSVELDGQRLHGGSTRESRHAGIATIYQELSLVPHMTVAQNVLLGAERDAHAVRGRFWLAPRSLVARAREVLDGAGIEIDPRARIQDLTMSQRQLVEIARALAQKLRLLVMDEPTSALSGAESDVLFRVIRGLKEGGIGIIYISHRLEEVKQIGDRVTVFRDGARISTHAVAAVDSETLVRDMAGRDLEALYPKEISATPQPLLEVEGLTHGTAFRDVSFTAHAGEVIGIYGVVGSGREAVVRCMYGAEHYDGGNVRVGGALLRPGSTRAAMSAGIAYVPPDRKQQGLVLPLTVRENMTLPVAGSLSRGGLLSPRAQRRVAAGYIKQLSIVPPRPDARVMYLSGGNQQKVVMAKGLVTRAKVFLLDEPTLGMDVSAKVAIYQLMNEVTEAGGSIVLSSSDTEEVLAMADRILVMHRGGLMASFDRQDATKERLLSAAFGLNREPGPAE
jgi:ribose transport system ATP-binding protein